MSHNTLVLTQKCVAPELKYHLLPNVFGCKGKRNTQAHIQPADATEVDMPTILWVEAMI